ncbi:uncharacterized protein LOC135926294 isoform X1 [Gordionus sp. m RMFG-2023]|uniref:uncharacterized protein LOC135926294 isoform X1 n=1 Tax=Gordionus sp. m RMFG-2023 TaxID=3053472 RepID=UPI0031FE3F5C
MFIKYYPIIVLAFVLLQVVYGLIRKNDNYGKLDWYSYKKSRHRRQPCTWDTYALCDGNSHRRISYPGCERFVDCRVSNKPIMNCGQGTLFNQNLQVCDWPDNVKCLCVPA